MKRFLVGIIGMSIYIAAIVLFYETPSEPCVKHYETCSLSDLFFFVIILGGAIPFLTFVTLLIIKRKRRDSNLALAIVILSVFLHVVYVALAAHTTLLGNVMYLTGYTVIMIIIVWVFYRKKVANIAS